MPKRTADARWEGSLQEGNGTMRLGSGSYEGAYSFKSRFQDGDGTNPEELIAAAHAGCFSMALSVVLGEAGYTPDSIETSAAVHIEQVPGGFGITKIELRTRGKVPGIGADEFAQAAQGAKEGCPVSKALAAVDSIELDAELVE
jgi:osmotically inducible protein OsmC